jgi:hypothetical protein
MLFAFDSARGEWSNILPELFPWEWHLPWARASVRESTAVRPEGADHASEPACAKDADASISRSVGTSISAGTRSACSKSDAGSRLVARPNVAKTARSKPSTPRRRRSAVSEPRPRPRLLRTRTLRSRVVTQQKVFFPSLMRSAGLPRSTRELTAQSGSLLLRRLPSGRPQCPGP